MDFIKAWPLHKKKEPILKQGWLNPVSVELETIKTHASKSEYDPSLVQN